MYAIAALCWSRCGHDADAKSSVLARDCEEAALGRSLIAVSPRCVAPQLVGVYVPRSPTRSNTRRSSRTNAVKHVSTLASPASNLHCALFARGLHTLTQHTPRTVRARTLAVQRHARDAITAHRQEQQQWRQ